VRLYLSSYRLGDHPEHLSALTGDSGKRAAVIANAVDDAPPEVRRISVERELADLAGLGFATAELDLRDYFGEERRLRGDLAGVDLAWLRGGNTFMLRYALRHSGGDDIFRDLLSRDSLVYAGYSAGCCVLSPSLRGLEIVDDADAVTRVYGSAPIWEGLGVLAEAFVPHYQTPGHPESAAIGQVAELYEAEGVPHRTLRDGQALVISDQGSVLV
jgi:dipeptidase E